MSSSHTANDPAEPMGSIEAVISAATAADPKNPNPETSRLGALVADAAAKIGDAGDLLSEAVLTVLGHRATEGRGEVALDDMSRLRTVLVATITSRLVELLVQRMLADQNRYP
jgi:hypothetical protein